mgnify:CR=1 FL=1
MEIRVARRYAQALFSVAKRMDMVPAVEDDLSAICGLLSQQPSFRQFLNSPHHSRDDRMTLFHNVFGDRVTALTMQLVRILVQKRRESTLDQIYREFVELRRKEQGVLTVVVTTAEEMPDSQRESLIKKLQSELGRKLEPEFAVDPSLIAGIRVAYENQVLDGSIRGGLNRLREAWRRDVLKQA